MTEDRPPQIDKELVDEFVLRAHGNLDFVQKTVEQEPQIVNGARDWGGGDWETALGAASHMGRRDIAQRRGRRRRGERGARAANACTGRRMSVGEGAKRSRVDFEREEARRATSRAS